MRPVHPVLQRLDDLAAHLATRPDAVALLGLGSAGLEIDRFDEYSDLDFFVVVVDAAAMARYLEDIGWLDAAGPVVHSFVNDPNGRKALLAGDVFAEYAVFTPGELAGIPFAGARVVWQRQDLPDGVAAGGSPPSPPALDTVDFHVSEALANLYVGLQRELRGERLTAARFVQSHAVDHVLALLRLTHPPAPGPSRDPFEPTRRVEQAYPPEVLPLAAMVPGYGRTRDAARAVLAWLSERFDVDPAMHRVVRDLLDRP